MQNNLGIELMTADRSDEALAAFRTGSADLSPTTPSPKAISAWRWFICRRFGTSHAGIPGGTGHRPSLYRCAICNLGHLLVQTGPTEEAIEHYRGALTKPNVAELHANLGHVLGLPGRGNRRWPSSRKPCG